MNLILFFKAEQFSLFDAPVNVKAAVRDGKTVKPYTRVQKIHAVGPHNRSAAANVAPKFSGASVMQYPSGRWGFAGKVPGHLLYARKDGQPMSDKDFADIRHAGAMTTLPGSPYKNVSFASKEEAEAALGKPQDAAVVVAAPSPAISGKFTVTIPIVGKVHADSLDALGEAAWQATHADGGHGYSEIGTGWPVHSDGKQVGTLRYNGRFDAAPTAVEKRPATSGGYYGVGTRANGSKGMVMGGPNTDWSKPWGNFQSVQHHGSKRAALDAMAEPMGQGGTVKKPAVKKNAPKILADKKGSNGRRYRLQARGNGFDVIWQDAYTWSYVNGGKAMKDEASARNLFDAMTL